jgi:hypothetical protein
VTDPGDLLLTPEQRADDQDPDPVIEALAVRLYESDPESAFQDDPYEVQWRDNTAHRDRYRLLARAAVAFLTGGHP